MSGRVQALYNKQPYAYSESLLKLEQIALNEESCRIEGKRVKYVKNIPLMLIKLLKLFRNVMFVILVVMLPSSLSIHRRFRQNQLSTCNPVFITYRESISYKVHIPLPAHRNDDDPSLFCYYLGLSYSDGCCSVRRSVLAATEIYSIAFYANRIQPTLFVMPS